MFPKIRCLYLASQYQATQFLVETGGLKVDSVGERFGDKGLLYVCFAGYHVAKIRAGLREKEF
jgi:hypothetical protein